MKRALIVSAHADDEVFGMGGSLIRLAEEGAELHWLVLTSLWEPKWSQEKVEARSAQIAEVADEIGFASRTQWDYQDNKLDTYPLDELQSKLIPVLDELKPDTIFSPGPWDFNFEHKLACQLVEMSTKPAYSPYIERIYGYEIPSSTEWSFQSRDNFSPTSYIRLSEAQLDKKLELCAIYEDELFDSPHGRSVNYLRALATKRGTESGVHYAEAFHLFREVS